jgi:transcriptional regulator with XRE-family HTH domain
MAANVFRFRLRELRQAKGWTQEELARRADMSVSTIRGLEQGIVADPIWSTVIKLAEVLETTTDAFRAKPATQEEAGVGRPKKSSTKGDRVTRQAFPKTPATQEEAGVGMDNDALAEVRRRMSESMPKERAIWDDAAVNSSKKSSTDRDVFTMHRFPKKPATQDPPSRIESASPPSDSPSPTTRGSSVSERIVELLTSALRPLPGAELAQACDCSYDSKFLGVVAQLESKGVVIKPTGGYWLAERPVPRRPSL